MFEKPQILWANLDKDSIWLLLLVACTYLLALLDVQFVTFPCNLFKTLNVVRKLCWNCCIFMLTIMCHKVLQIQREADDNILFHCRSLIWFYVDCNACSSQRDWSCIRLTESFRNSRTWETFLYKILNSLSYSCATRREQLLSHKLFKYFFWINFWGLDRQKDG